MAEWCADAAEFSDDKVLTDTYRDGVTDPFSTRGSRRIRRGGAWCLPSDGCRSAARSCDVPSTANYYIGFRPVLAARPNQ